MLPSRVSQRTKDLDSRQRSLSHFTPLSKSIVALTYSDQTRSGAAAILYAVGPVNYTRAEINLSIIAVRLIQIALLAATVYGLIA